MGGEISIVVHSFEYKYNYVRMNTVHSCSRQQTDRINVLLVGNNEVAALLTRHARTIPAGRYCRGTIPIPIPYAILLPIVRVLLVLFVFVRRRARRKAAPSFDDRSRLEVSSTPLVPSLHPPSPAAQYSMR